MARAVVVVLLALAAIGGIAAYVLSGDKTVVTVRSPPDAKREALKEPPPPRR